MRPTLDTRRDERVMRSACLHALKQQMPEIIKRLPESKVALLGAVMERLESVNANKRMKGTDKSAAFTRGLMQLRTEGIIE